MLAIIERSARKYLRFLLGLSANDGVGMLTLLANMLTLVATCCNHRCLLTLAANDVPHVGMPALRNAAPSSAVRSGSCLSFWKRRTSVGCVSSRSAGALGI